MTDKTPWTMPLLAGAMIISSALATAGCDSNLADMPDDELQTKMYKCTQANDKAPGYAIACENYERECLVRREQNRFIC